MDGYKAACAELLTRLDHAKEPEEIQTLAQTLVLGPDAVKDYAGLLETTAKLDRRRLRGWRVWDVHSAALLRAGKADEAAERLTKLFKDNPSMQTPWNWLLLALVRQRQGQTQVSAVWLRKVAESLDPTAKPSAEATRRRVFPWQQLSWEARLELMLLRREAEKMGH